MPHPKWPKTLEDELLDAYWRQRGSGTLYTEVSLGKDAWKTPPTQNGAGGKFRLDAVIAESSGLDGPFGHKAFRNAVEGKDVRECEIVEVKPGLSEWVIGQALVGRCLFEAQTEGLTNVGRTTVVSRHIDPAMRWVAQKLDLHVAQPLPVEKPKLMRSRPQYALKTGNSGGSLRGANRQAVPA